VPLKSFSATESKLQYGHFEQESFIQISDNSQLKFCCNSSLTQGPDSFYKLILTFYIFG